MDSVKDLLARAVPGPARAATSCPPGLTRVTEQAKAHGARENAWRSWLGAHLPAEITGKISTIVERDGTLVIYAESAAWSARLRYAVMEIDAQLRGAHPQITEISVRVLPRGQAR
jgi:hypothetical protein